MVGYLRISKLTSTITNQKWCFMHTTHQRSRYSRRDFDAIRNKKVTRLVNAGLRCDEARRLFHALHKNPLQSHIVKVAKIYRNQLRRDWELYESMVEASRLRNADLVDDILRHFRFPDVGSLKQRRHVLYVLMHTFHPVE